MSHGNVWNSTLKRRTPLRGKGFFKKRDIPTGPKKTPSKRIKKVSDKRAGEMRLYTQVRKQFLAENAVCRICYVRGIAPANPATEVHHARGRANSLLVDTRGFVASCFPCREWPHEHPREARKLGVLNEARDWGQPFDR